MNGSTIVIHKSAFGLWIIFLAGALIVSALLLGLATTTSQDHLTLTDTLPRLIILGILVVVIGTFVQAYVYMLSKVVLDGEELRFVNWPTLFYSNVAVCEWRQVQDVDVKKGGILSQAFDYGTLLVQTAGTERNLRIPMIPNVEHYRDLIAAQADAAATPIKQAS